MNSASASCSSVAWRVRVLVRVFIVGSSNYIQLPPPRSSLDSEPGSARTSARAPGDVPRRGRHLLEPQRVEGQTSRAGDEQKEAASHEHHGEPSPLEAFRGQVYPEEQTTPNCSRPEPEPRPKTPSSSAIPRTAPCSPPPRKRHGDRNANFAMLCVTWPMPPRRTSCTPLDEDERHRDAHGQYAHPRVEPHHSPQCASWTLKVREPRVARLTKHALPAGPSRAGPRHYRLLHRHPDRPERVIWIRQSQSWLVLQLTNSPFLLGLTATLQFGPICCSRCSPRARGSRDAAHSSPHHPKPQCGLALTLGLLASLVMGHATGTCCRRGHWGRGDARSTSRRASRRDGARRPRARDQSTSDSTPRRSTVPDHRAVDRRCPDRGASPFPGLFLNGAFGFAITILTMIPGRPSGSAGWRAARSRGSARGRLVRAQDRSSRHPRAADDPELLRLQTSASTSRSSRATGSAWAPKARPLDGRARCGGLATGSPWARSSRERRASG